MKKTIVFVITLWLFVVGSSYYWNMTDQKTANTRLAFEIARAFFQQVVTTRSWNAMHGGVYVPVTEDVQPNLYLQDPLRDLATDKNIYLTKINPAYMTRQLAEIAFKKKMVSRFILQVLSLLDQKTRLISGKKSGSNILNWA